jgi:Coenzyme PQQ synthesis protein D (PqqD)
MRPQARRHELVSQEVGDELVIYDERIHSAHRLNRTAAAIWRLADGQRTIEELARQLHETLDVPEDEDLVYLALEELAKADLLVGEVPFERERMSRRAMLASFAAIVPIVASIKLEAHVAFSPV